MKLKEALRGSNLLSVYFTAGYPQLNDTQTIIKSLEAAGANIIEVGLPYSDPPADGPVIQQSSSAALAGGITADIVFEQLSEIKNTVEIPLILMGYLNQMLVYGTDAFLQKCKESGIQALIIPDLPPEIYEKEYKELFEKYEQSNIFLISPQTPAKRIRMIDSLTDTFIYMVSSSSVTGGRKEISREQREYFERVRALKLKNPVLIGFGISNNETFKKACEYASGAIIGSAFIKKLSPEKDLDKIIHKFVKRIKK